MAETSRVPPAAAPVIPDELLWEILVRLPAKELLRCRSVCREWGRLATSADFLLTMEPTSRSESRAVDAVDLRRAPAEFRRELAFSNYTRQYGYHIHASCDGLLLLSIANQGFCICNPATGQCSSLPGLTRVEIVELYPHRSSGEYRVLYWKRRRLRDSNHFAAFYYILTVGKEKPRCIGLPLSVHSESIKERLAAGLLDSTYLLPVLLNSCLHWYVVYPQEAIVVFDTVLELFRPMASPNVKDATARLLEIDGTLGVGFVRKEGTAKLWVLQNYEMEVWSFKCQVEFSLVEMRSIAGEGFYYGSVVSDHGEMFKLLEKFRMYDIFPGVQGHFKESLVSHEFFQRQDGARARHPHFFCGP